MNSKKNYKRTKIVRSACLVKFYSRTGEYSQQDNKYDSYSQQDNKYDSYSQQDKKYNSSAKGSQQTKNP